MPSVLEDVKSKKRGFFRFLIGNKSAEAQSLLTTSSTGAKVAAKGIKGGASEFPDGGDDPHEASDYIKSIVFGGLDGIVTTFAIVASVVGASYPLEVVMITGFAKLFGDGLSMGLGDCLSERAEQAHILGERRREEWEYINHPDGERGEMIEIYKEKGLSEADARRLIEIITSKPEYSSFFVDHMMVQELGLQVPDEGDNPIKDGAVTFVSFLFWGSIPLWAYVVFYLVDYKDNTIQFVICIAMTLLCLFGLGAMQARILKQNILKQGLGMVLNGGLAAGAAYLIGWGLQQAVSADAGLCSV